VPKIKVIPYISNYRYAKFGEFWTSGRPPFWISKFERLKFLEIQIEMGPACQSEPPLNQTHRLPACVCDTVDSDRTSLVFITPHALPALPLSSAGIEHRSQDIFYPSPTTQDIFYPSPAS
jgi:hypothetical protein